MEKLQYPFHHDSTHSVTRLTSTRWSTSSCNILIRSRVVHGLPTKWRASFSAGRGNAIKEIRRKLGLPAVCSLTWKPPLPSLDLPSRWVPHPGPRLAQVLPSVTCPTPRAQLCPQRIFRQIRNLACIHTPIASSSKPTIVCLDPPPSNSLSTISGVYLTIFPPLARAYINHNGSQEHTQQSTRGCRPPYSPTSLRSSPTPLLLSDLLTI